MLCDTTQPHMQMQPSSQMNCDCEFPPYMFINTYFSTRHPTNIFRKMFVVVHFSSFAEICWFLKIGTTHPFYVAWEDSCPGFTYFYHDIVYQ